MKKWIFAGVSVLLALALTMVACDDLTSKDIEGGDEFAEYSADGKYLTINLEGGGPSKSMSRALTNSLARLNHDYYEVVFFHSEVAGGATGNKFISRTSWDRGEGAALSVYRGKDPTFGIKYGSVDYASSVNGTTGAVDTGAAILFVGKRTLKGATLLAVGTLTGVADGASPIATGDTVKNTTTKVRFEIASLASSVTTTVPIAAGSSSFYTKFSNAAATEIALTPYTFDATGLTAIDAATSANSGDGTGFAKQKLRTAEYPMFILMSDQAETGAQFRRYAAKFTFDTAIATGAASTPHTMAEYIKGIISAGLATTDHTYAEVRAPVALIDGQAVTFSTHLETVKVAMMNNLVASVVGTPASAFSNVAHFQFDVPPSLESGFLGFHFSIPVFAITSSPGNGVAAVQWFIQPGIESYLENGKGLGSSILFGIGDPSKINIETGFVGL